MNVGETAILSITFAPAGTGDQSGSITVTSNAQISSITVELQATGVPAPAHLATLSWNSSPVAGYFVYRSTTRGGPYARLNAALDTNTTYADSAVVAGATYYYVVTAVDSSNEESGYSKEVGATIPMQ